MQHPLSFACEEEQLSHGCWIARLLSFLMPVHPRLECMHAGMPDVSVCACMHVSQKDSSQVHAAAAHITLCFWSDGALNLLH